MHRVSAVVDCSRSGAVLIHRFGLCWQGSSCGSHGGGSSDCYLVRSFDHLIITLNIIGVNNASKNPAEGQDDYGEYKNWQPQLPDFVSLKAH